MQTMVGIPMVLAKIAVCDLVEPLEVMIPVTFGYLAEQSLMVPNHQLQE